MFKKWIALALALCLCLSLAACAQTPASSTQPASSTAVESKDASSVETEKELYPIVDSPLTVKGVVFGNMKSNKRLIWDKLAELTGITVDWKIIANDQKMVYLSAGEWPDIFHNGFSSSEIEDYGVTGKRLVNLEDYADIMPYLQQTYRDYADADAKKMVMASDGGIYQLVQIDNGPTNVVCRIHYNKYLLDQNNLSIPTSVDEFYEVLKALKNVTGAAPIVDKITPDQTYMTVSKEWFYYAAFGTSTNPNFEDDGTGTVIYNRASDQYRYYLQYMNKLYADGLLHQEYLTLDATTKASLIDDGKAVFGFDQFTARPAEAFGGSFDNLGTLAPLTSQYDSTREVVGSSPAMASGFVVSASSKHIPEILKMLDVLFATEEVKEGTGMYGVIGVYGPENVTWQWANDAHTEYTYILPEGYTGAVNSYQVENVIFVNAGRYDVFKNAVVAEQSNNRARQLGYIENLKPYQTATQFPANKLALTDDEKTVIDNYLTELQSNVYEWNAAFITGTKNPNDDAVWSEYCAGFDKLHLAEVTAAYQSAYTRYLALD